MRKERTEEKGERREEGEEKRGKIAEREREKGRENNSGEIEILIDRYIDKHLDK